MTVIAHAAIGGMVYAVPLHLVGAPADACGAAFALGAVFGAMPDALPWTVGRLTERGDIEQWLREFLHNPPQNAARIMGFLVAPWLHVVADRYAHPPRLPDPGTSPWHDRVVIGKIAVRDLLWCAGELSLWAIVALLMLL